MLHFLSLRKLPALGGVCVSCPTAADLIHFNPPRIGSTLLPKGREGWDGGRGSWRARIGFRACLGTMNRWPPCAGRKAPINRTHSRRFARFGDARQSRSVWSARGFSAAFPRQAKLRFDGRVGSWKVFFRRSAFLVAFFNAIFANSQSIPKIESDYNFLREAWQTLTLPRRKTFNEECRSYVARVLSKAFPRIHILNPARIRL